MTAATLFCAGVPVSLGERIGRGGEGVVYAIAGNSTYAIKLYLRPDAAHEVKVRAMIAAQLAGKCASVTFPLRLVTDDSDRFAGFSMRRAYDSEPIFELFGSGSRRERFPKADWAFLVRTATNVARVVAQVHAGGAVIGDINSSGFLVSQHATVTLIDADSFQVAGHRCRVGMPEYTPPDLQGIRFDEVDRTIDHDAFGLAVMIFQVLALGRHPHAGVRNGRSIPLETAITQGRFAYSLIRKVGSTPPPRTLTMSDLPLGIRTLFERAFGLRMGPRPTAAEWVNELALFEAGLARCQINPAHVMPALSAPCPWCRIEKELGRSLFPPTKAERWIPQPVRTDLHYEVARVVRFATEHAGENIQPMWRRSDASPSKAVAKLLRENMKPCNLAATLGIGFALTNDVSTQAFVQRYEAAQTVAAQALDQWRSDLGIWDINIRAETLREELRNLDRFKASEPVLISQATDRVISTAALRTMRNLPLDAADVPGIGTHLRAQLVLHGVATAADVTRDRLSTIPRLGDARGAALLLWRDRVMVEAQRLAARDQLRLAQGIAAEMASVGNQIEHAEDALRAQCADLEHRAAKVRDQVLSKDHAVESALADRDRAAADLDLLGIERNTRLAIPSGTPRSPAFVPAPTPTKRKKKSKQTKQKSVVCPACGAPMVKRWATAAQGGGKLFLGCSAYPRCSGSRPIMRKRTSP